MLFIDFRRKDMTVHVEEHLKKYYAPSSQQVIFTLRILLTLMISL